VTRGRTDLKDVQEGDPASLDRIDFALRESTALLRAKVSQLHPAVLEQAGVQSARRRARAGVARRM
jgi:two-component system, NarL family, sensor kinase